ncbi:7tm 7 domain containing protein [Asbolus verrucosus]|uniref:Gustatory receptor n=1 Tax=Asbolus verrucosus TaxID=1661398 RepID=A0A482WB00_ASBVE|nr:7tm 7 domain containing protein [Asbolus verrucosus]
MLDCLFKIGRILALTPSTVNHTTPSLFRKAYQFLIFTIYTACLILTKIYIKEYYMRYMSPYKVLLICLNINYYVYNFYVLVIVMVTKRQLWMRLLVNLKNIDCQIKQGSFKLILILAHVAFFIVTSAGIYLYLIVFGLTYTELNIIDCFENYSLFFYVICTCITLYLILSRYKHQILLLQKKRINIKQIKRNMLTLKESVNNFNDIFGWIILLNIFYCAIKCLIFIDIMIKSREAGRSHFLRLYCVGIVLLNGAGISTTVLLCDAILKEFEKIWKIVFKMQIWSEHQKFETFVAIVSHSRPKFTAARFFLIDRSTLFSIVNTILTFLLVLIQFKSG